MRGCVPPFRHYKVQYLNLLEQIEHMMDIYTKIDDIP